MPKFTYTATNKEGKSLQGTLEAASHAAALEILTHQGIRPITVHEQAVGDSKKSKFVLGKSHKVKSKDLVIFTRQLSTMISAGVPLNKSLITMQDQATNAYFKEVIGGVAKDVEGGIALGDAFGKYPNVFSDIFINMVKAGESGGILDEILKRLATQVEKDASIKKKIKSASAYPTVLVFVTVAAFFLIMLVVMPKLAKIIGDLTGGTQKLPIYTRILLGISNFMVSYALFIIPSLIIGVFLFLKYIKTPKGKLWWHGMLLRIPILKTVVLKVSIARFARTFASLMSAGVGVLDALESTAGAIGNLVISNELRAAAVEVKNGKQLSEPLSRSPHFPAIVSQMLSVGEETGQIDTILLKVADFYEEEVDATIDALASIIEPIMIVILGAMVGLIAASVMGPIAGLSKNIKNG